MSPSKLSPRDVIRAEFAQRLAKEMDKRGWTQSDMARAAQKFLPTGETFRRDAIHVYLNKSALPRPRQLNAIAKALGLQPEDLLPGVRTASETLPLSMRTLPDKPGKAWLHVDMECSLATAAAIISMLERDQ